MKRAVAGVLLKGMQLSIVPNWLRYTFLRPTFLKLVREGYKQNAVVATCLRCLTLAFQEAPLRAIDGKGNPLPSTHPLQRLLLRPNPVMSQAEWLMYNITYMGLGGNSYNNKQRSPDGRVVELWPYHDGHITPVPGGKEVTGESQWVKFFRYDIGDGNIKEIMPSEIDHHKWPMIDPESPWRGMSPLETLKRETDTLNELSDSILSILKNDATPQTVVSVPADVEMGENPEQEWREKFAGKGRGGVAFLQGAGRVTRIGSTMKELEVDGLRHAPEASIASAFGVPLIVAQLWTGVERAMDANFSASLAMFAENTMVPLWKLFASTLENSLRDEFSGDWYLEFDTSKVKALQESEDKQQGRIIEQVDAGVLAPIEARTLFGHVGPWRDAKGIVPILTAFAEAKIRFESARAMAEIVYGFTAQEAAKLFPEIKVEAPLLPKNGKSHLTSKELALL